MSQLYSWRTGLSQLLWTPKTDTRRGQKWLHPSSQALGGEDEAYLLAVLPDRQSLERSDRENIAAGRVAQWARDQLGVALTPATLDATGYVLDRMTAGLSRSSLLRGHNNSLMHDPAMRFLGIAPEVARIFAHWLLGRNDFKRTAPGVLDAVAQYFQPDEMRCARWRDIALRSGLAQRLNHDPAASSPD